MRERATEAKIKAQERATKNGKRPGVGNVLMNLK